MSSATILVDRKALRNLLADFEKLLDDLELIAEQKTLEKVDKSVKEIRARKVKGLTKKDFYHFLKEKGVSIE